MFFAIIGGFISHSMVDAVLAADVANAVKRLEQRLANEISEDFVDEKIKNQICKCAAVDLRGTQFTINQHINNGLDYERRSLDERRRALIVRLDKDVFRVAMTPRKTPSKRLRKDSLEDLSP